jgi:hypothetical protein
VRESKRSSRRSNAWPHSRVTPLSHQCREPSCRSSLDRSISRTLTAHSHYHARLLAHRTRGPRPHHHPARLHTAARLSSLPADRTHDGAGVVAHTGWRRRREVRTRFDATRLPGGSCEHSARRYPPSAKPLLADGASGLSAAASAPRIPTPRRVLVECDRLGLLQVFTNASADGALRFLVVDEIIIQIGRLVASARRERRPH